MESFLALITPVGGAPGYPAHPIAPGGPPPTVWPPGYPAHPIAPGGPPPGIWGGAPLPWPTPPIYYPPPSPGYPAHPIAPGGPPPEVGGGPIYPPGIWPSPGHPAHPIVLPDDQQPLIEWKTAWSPQTGWIVVGIPQVPHPAPAEATGEQQP